MSAASASRPWPGRPVPLGATWDGAGTNFALFSAAAKTVELCLQGDAGAPTSFPLEETFQVWHGYLPGVRPGQRYAFRVGGVSGPLAASPTGLLLDPYARALDDDLLAIVTGADFPWGDEPRPAMPWPRTVIYELHVRGFSVANPAVPELLRGSYAGLAHPASTEYLRALGVTAVELMPVAQFVSEPALIRRALTNYWGYNSIGFFAPHAAYSASGRRGQQVTEFKAMVRALHAAGLEVILDVVYNHTAEGEQTGPTLAFRGIDPAYYRRDEHGRYADVSGCGNTLDLGHPRVLALVLDSLRYWITEMHVDGFRFDLAPALTRDSCFLDALLQDPLISGVKLIAEPWDLGRDGYRLGGFPPPWAEWNDRYRDTIRDFWRGAEPGVRELGCRLSGSSDLFEESGRRPYASINYVTSHDGFTARDLTTYEHKHNEANGDGNRDGTDDNRAWNCGIEGETDDVTVAALRRRQARNHLATLLLSTGVPMLLMGDELCRTQHGNNNAYCQDNETSWLDWVPTAEAVAMLDFVRRLVALRAASPALRQATFFRGQLANGSSIKDLAWFTADGVEMSEADWHTPTVGMYLCGEAIRDRGRRGEPVRDESYLLVLHGAFEDGTFRLPGQPWASSYDIVLDTAVEGSAALPANVPAGALLPLTAHSLVLLRACRAAALSRVGL